VHSDNRWPAILAVLRGASCAVRSVAEAELRISLRNSKGKRIEPVQKDHDDE